MINATFHCFLASDIHTFFHEIVIDLQDLKSLERQIFWTNNNQNMIILLYDKFYWLTVFFMCCACEIYFHKEVEF